MIPWPELKQQVKKYMYIAFSHVNEIHISVHEKIKIQTWS